MSSQSLNQRLTLENIACTDLRVESRAVAPLDPVLVDSFPFHRGTAEGAHAC